MDRRMNGRTERWVGGWGEEWEDRRMDGKMDGRQHRAAVRGADKEPVVCANALLSVVLIGGAVRGADADYSVVPIPRCPWC